jgi:putative peptidoglycan lipid II flippase
LSGLGFAPMLASLGKIAVASALMGMLVWAGALLVTRLPLPAKGQDLLAVGGLIPLACAVYGGLLLLLRIEGREELAELWAKFRAKLPGA